jgi:hypothetical protein
VESVCQSWLGAVFGLAKRSAAFIRMKAGLAITGPVGRCGPHSSMRPWAGSFLVSDSIQ